MRGSKNAGRAEKKLRSGVAGANALMGREIIEGGSDGKEEKRTKKTKKKRRQRTRTNTPPIGGVKGMAKTIKGRKGLTTVRGEIGNENAKHLAAG